MFRLEMQRCFLSNCRIAEMQNCRTADKRQETLAHQLPFYTRKTIACIHAHEKVCLERLRFLRHHVFCSFAVTRAIGKWYLSNKQIPKKPTRRAHLSHGLALCRRTSVSKRPSSVIWFMTRWAGQAGAFCSNGADIARRGFGTTETSSFSAFFISYSKSRWAVKDIPAQKRWSVTCGRKTPRQNRPL